MTTNELIEQLRAADPVGTGIVMIPGQWESGEWEDGCSNEYKTGDQYPIQVQRGSLKNSLVEIYCSDKPSCLPFGSRWDLRAEKR